MNFTGNCGIRNPVRVEIHFEQSKGRKDNEAFSSLKFERCSEKEVIFESVYSKRQLTESNIQ